jgi:hypothetical protein
MEFSSAGFGTGVVRVRQSFNFNLPAHIAPSSQSTGRNAGHLRSDPDICRHDGAGGDYRVVANADAFEDYRVRADPNVVAHLDRSFDERLVRDWRLFTKSMIVVG